MHPICVTCGVQFEDRERPPEVCPVCADERQFVGWAGQRWTTLEGLKGSHRLALKDEGDGLIGIGCEPRFAIGQRALLLPARPNDGPGRNLLWDCISLIDAAAVRLVEGLGGLGGIAISHPHFYASMVEWSRAFGGAPIWLHADDRAWVMRPDPAIRFWEGEKLELGAGLTLVRLGGHFPGGQVLHWADGAGRPGRASERRHRPGGPGPALRELHAQFSQLHPAAGRGGPPDRGPAGAVRVRADLWRLVRPRGA